MAKGEDATSCPHLEDKMAKQKYCPLTFTTGPVVSDFSYCRKKSCAWWDDLVGLCAILVIAKLGSCGSEGSYYNHPTKKEEKKK